MTFLEKAMEINENEGRPQVASAIIRRNCPYDYGLEENDVCNRVGEEKCFECWNREMPNTETKVEVIPQSEVDAYNKGHADGMAQGMNDAWEIVLKIIDMYTKSCEGAFGTYSSKIREEDRNQMFSIMKAFTPQEALAKLKAYEEAQIEVGDVVESMGTYALIIWIDDDCSYVNAIKANGGTCRWVKKGLKKTGKHIDIKAILDQIGE